MLASLPPPRDRRLLDHPPSAWALVQMALEPLTAIGVLFIVMWWFGQSMTGPYMILTLLVISLTFPGRAPRSGGTRWALALQVLGGWLVLLALLLLIGWVTRGLGYFSQQVMLSWALLSPLALFTLHSLTPRFLPRYLEAKGMHRVAVIAGHGELGRKLADQIRRSPVHGIRFAGYFDDRDPERTGPLQPGEALGRLDELAEYAKNHKVDLIYITLPIGTQPRIQGLLERLNDTTASVYFTPNIFLFDTIQARLDSIGEVPVVAVCESPFHGFNWMVKRLSDLVLASVILLLISPLLLLIALGVKLTSPGPVLFKQRRYGLDGQQIIVYKFRSMAVLEDGDQVRQATVGDKRVTRFGAFLRRTSLDELPQFINVLQGRMSVVGPRPHAVAHNEMYRKLIRGYMIRHKVKPGITGWAQVNGLRGETDTVEKMRSRIEYDLAYLQNWSLALDLRIILRTIRVVVKDQNAY